jgi:transcriptional regulator with PAS, ATPase and Fis domain
VGIVGNILMAWLGDNDVRAAHGDAEYINKYGVGPICQAIKDIQFDQLVLLHNDKDSITRRGGREIGTVRGYIEWIEGRGIKVENHHCPLTTPIHFGDIWAHAEAQFKGLQGRHRTGSAVGRRDKIHFHLTPGTPTMQAVWILLGKTTKPSATLIQTTPPHATKDNKPRTDEAEIPFDIYAALAPIIHEHVPSEDEIDQTYRTEFKQILHKSAAMKHAVRWAKKVAPHVHATVLLYGESGTGKELFAKAIHKASKRPRKGRFETVNCGAIPKELVESELFGIERGAASGVVAREGHFMKANGGTIFLDEIGEMPLRDQVKLLRVLQEKKVRKVGGEYEIDIDVRVIAATNRDLWTQVEAGKFREDLYWRLAEFTYTLPPLRDRSGDLDVLVPSFLEEFKESRKLTDAAMNVLRRHHWRGNIRELRTVIKQAMVLVAAPEIDAKSIAGLLQHPTTIDSNILNRELGPDFDLGALKHELALHYVNKAQEECGGGNVATGKLLNMSHTNVGKILAKQPT